MAQSAAFLVLAGCTSGEDTKEEAPAEMRRLTRADLEDKVRGGWAGQMIGVAYGAPTEFRSLGKTIEGDIAWTPEQVSGTLEQDDLYVEMTFAQVMDTVGLDATTEQYGEMFGNSQYNLWHANAGARRNLRRGIKAPMSGHPKYNLHANDIDFQIESDFIGLMTPGLPREANRFADRVGRVMNYGDGLYGGMFVAGMYAAAYFEQDPRRVVEAGLRSIPAESGYAQAIADTLAGHEANPHDWLATWQILEERWNRHDLCPDGAESIFNIDARLNGAYIALGLLYGEGDFAETIEISTRAGQDSDCNPSSAAGVLGVMIGYQAIPEEWKSGIPAIENEKFAYTEYSLNDIVDSTMERAAKIVQAVGGEVSESAFLIPLQEPQPAALEQWNSDPPRQRVALTDAAWNWSSQWADDAIELWGREVAVKTSSTPGSTVSLSFEGSGIALVGRLTQDGGRADVYIDEQLSDITLDAWIPERTWDNDLWHVTGLPLGEHTVRVVLREDAHQSSTGKRVQLRSAIVYGPAQPKATSE